MKPLNIASSETNTFEILFKLMLTIKKMYNILNEDVFHKMNNDII